MGLLALGTPLAWSDAAKHADYVREHGIEQLLHIWERLKDRTGDRLLWGDEVRSPSTSLAGSVGDELEPGGSEGERARGWRWGNSTSEGGRGGAGWTGRAHALREPLQCTTAGARNLRRRDRAPP